MKTSVYFLSYLAQFLLEWEMFKTNVAEKIKTLFVFSEFFEKSCYLWHSVKKYCTAGQAADDNKAHSYIMLDT